MEKLLYILASSFDSLEQFSGLLEMLPPGFEVLKILTEYNITLNFRVVNKLVGRDQEKVTSDVAEIFLKC